MINWGAGILPAIIVRSNNSLLAAGLINEKGYNKSIEQGELWLIDQQSGKLLPDPYIRGYSRIGYKNGYIEVLAEHYLYEEREAKPQATNMAEPKTSERGGRIAGAEPEMAERSRNSLGAEPSSVLLTDEQVELELAKLEDASPALKELFATINKRKTDRPKGSYTTYLFEKGEEKIRKKVGEEAVEVILSGTNSELEAETADLLYHLIVLFVERGASFGDVLRKANDWK